MDTVTDSAPYSLSSSSARWIFLFKNDTEKGSLLYPSIHLSINQSEILGKKHTYRTGRLEPVHDTGTLSYTSIIIITTSMIPVFVLANIWDRDRDWDWDRGHRTVLQYRYKNVLPPSVVYRSLFIPRISMREVGGKNEWMDEYPTEENKIWNRTGTIVNTVLRGR